MKKLILSFSLIIISAVILVQDIALLACCNKFRSVTRQDRVTAVETGSGEYLSEIAG